MSCHIRVLCPPCQAKLISVYKDRYSIHSIYPSILFSVAKKDMAVLSFPAPMHSIALLVSSAVDALLIFTLMFVTVGNHTFD